MIFCARATRGRGLPSLDARSGRSISPHPLEKKMSEIGWITSKYGIIQVRVVEGSVAALLLAERAR